MMNPSPPVSNAQTPFKLAARNQQLSRSQLNLNTTQPSAKQANPSGLTTWLQNQKTLLSTLLIVSSVGLLSTGLLLGYASGSAQISNLGNMSVDLDSDMGELAPPSATPPNVSLPDLEVTTTPEADHGHHKQMSDAEAQEAVLALMVPIPDTKEIPSDLTIAKSLPSLPVALPKKGNGLFRLIVPVKQFLITSRYGMRWGRPHQGIDFAGPSGTPIYASEAGKVVHSGWESGYGKSVVIHHPNGLETRYAHCSNLNVSYGDTVSKGQIIAKMGSTGRSTGPHLHYEVIAYGMHKNPETYLFR